MKPDYVDFHTHLDLYPDLASAIATCDRRRTATLTVTTTPKAFARNVELTQASEFVRAGLGLHPQLVAERFDEIELFERLLPTSRYVGEVGLDSGPAHYRTLTQQKTVFARILRACCREGGKILSVHSVRATKAVLDMLEEHLPRDRGKVVLHWFVGSKSEVRRAVKLGCYFSVNESMLSSASGKRVLDEIPADRMLTETDGPFVIRGDVPIDAGNVARAIEMIAECTHTAKDHIQHQILCNLKALTRRD